MQVVAGTMVTASGVLAMVHSPNWVYLTLFVGLNLFQSGITRWCLLEDILKAAGFKSSCRESSEDPLQEVPAR